MVVSDPQVIVERMLGPKGLMSKTQAGTPPLVGNIEEILPDMYLDRLLSKGDPTETDRWLRRDLQAEMDHLPEATRRRYAVGRLIATLRPITRRSQKTGFPPKSKRLVSWTRTSPSIGPRLFG